MASSGSFRLQAVQPVVPAQGASAASIWDGVYTEEQAKRGQSLYAQQCAFCHGDSLTDGTQAPPLAGDAFLASWKGNSLGALFEKTSTMMPSNDPGSLSKEQYADVLAYILSVGKAPAGKTELKGETELLKLIRIEAKPESKQSE
jgi:mono/diheme cytochrome c family protein